MQTHPGRIQLAEILVIWNPLFCALRVCGAALAFVLHWLLHWTALDCTGLHYTALHALHCTCPPVLCCRPAQPALLCAVGCHGRGHSKAVAPLSHLDPPRPALPPSHPQSRLRETVGQARSVILDWATLWREDKRGRPHRSSLRLSSRAQRQTLDQVRVWCS